MPLASFLIDEIPLLLFSSTRFLSRQEVGLLLQKALGHLPSLIYRSCLSFAWDVGGGTVASRIPAAVSATTKSSYCSFHRGLNVEDNKVSESERGRISTRSSNVIVPFSTSYVCQVMNLRLSRRATYARRHYAALLSCANEGTESCYLENRYRIA